MGIHPDVVKKAKEKGLQVINASCPFVMQTQKIVLQKLAEGYTIFYIGKEGHPEAESIVTLSDQVHLITNTDLPSITNTKIFVTNQTTMSIFDIQHVFETIQKTYPHAQIQNELCNATRVRQQAILDLENQSVDVLLVVGDPTSNNTQKLAEIGKSIHIKKVLGHSIY